ncbi:MAG: diphosphomevalonate decarboxylase [bacterium]|nr:diphosphomevalonate decarboxylase [bacterium]
MTEHRSATATAPANIAFIKYWGNRDERLNLPQNPSLSMNLDGLLATTTVTWRDDTPADTLFLNDAPASDDQQARISVHLDLLRERLMIESRADVVSRNNFPMGAGIASSAAGFAALTVAGAAAAGVQISERELSTLARVGSGSASRSVPSGFVRWHQGSSHETSFAESVAPPGHWNLIDVIAVVSQAHKAVGSKAGHRSADSSDLQAARVAGAAARLDVCQQALLDRDFAAFAEVVEHDSNLMHAVMMTSRPPLFYWQPATLTVMEQVRGWRAEGLRVCYTLDAGPNVHCICVGDDADEVSRRLAVLSGIVDIRRAGAGEGARPVLA